MVNYIKIIRPVNLAIIGCAVALGAWITFPRTPPGAAGGLGTPAFWAAALTAALTLMAAAAYGNVINDVTDVESDRVNHPRRPLASGAMSVRSATIYAAALAAAALAFAAAASTFHLIAAIVIVALLTLYSTRLKRTALAGNLTVASLTAYALLHGSLPRPETKILIAPAALAFLLNFCRELVKDVEDAPGDAAAGWRTSASLPPGTIKAALLIMAAIYMIIVPAPSLIFGHFGTAYTAVCLTTVIPIHIYWVTLTVRAAPLPARKIGSILKLEMIAGLLALALDRGF